MYAYVYVCVFYNFGRLATSKCLKPHTRAHTHVMYTPWPAQSAAKHTHTHTHTHARTHTHNHMHAYHVHTLVS